MKHGAEFIQRTKELGVMYPDFETAYIQTPGKIAVNEMAKLYGLKPANAYALIFQQGLRKQRQAYWKDILGDKQAVLKEKIGQCYDQALEGWEDLYVRIQLAMAEPNLKAVDVNALANAMDKFTRHMHAMNQTHGDQKEYESLYQHIGNEQALDSAKEK